MGGFVGEPKIEWCEIYSDSHEFEMLSRADSDQEVQLSFDNLVPVKIGAQQCRLDQPLREDLKVQK